MHHFLFTIHFSRFIVFKVLRLHLPHRPCCLFIYFMIESQEVQDTVDKKSLQLLRKGMPKFRSLSPGRFPGYDHITQKLPVADRALSLDLGKGKDIG